MAHWLDRQFAARFDCGELATGVHIEYVAPVSGYTGYVRVIIGLGQSTSRIFDRNTPPEKQEVIPLLGGVLLEALYKAGMSGITAGEISTEIHRMLELDMA